MQPAHILDSMDVVEKLFFIVCYTDGSKIDNSVGFAYVFFVNGVEIDLGMRKFRFFLRIRN